MTEPTRDQIAKDYALALTIIDRLRTSNEELLAALKAVLVVARTFNTKLDDEFTIGPSSPPPEFAAADAAIAKATSR